MQVSRAGKEVEVHFFAAKLRCGVDARGVKAVRGGNIYRNKVPDSMLPMSEGIASTVKISEAHCTH